MKIVMNEKRVAIVEAIKNAEGAMTIAEISAVVGFEVKSGTTNAMVKAGIMVKSGVREIVCAVCGSKHKVTEYTFGSMEGVEIASK